jgi:hypothetical protein
LQQSKVHLLLQDHLVLVKGTAGSDVETPQFANRIRANNAIIE